MDINQFYQEITDEPLDKPKTFGLADFGTKIWNQTSLHKLNGLTHFATSVRKKSGYKEYIGKFNVKNYETKYKNLYNLLSDERSKKTLLCVLTYRLTGKYADIHAESDYASNQYFDKDIVSFTNQEVFVDCGGYIGDTAEIFINRIIHDFSKIYIYEPTPEYCSKASHLLSLNHPDKINKIIFREAGVGLINCKSKISFMGAGSQISDKGECSVEVVSLDEDITEPISFIKMDIEGFELDALKGAKQHIISEKPKLAICVYHKIDDLWEIPEYILSLDSSYKLYLRQYFTGDGENPWDTVLYAI